MSKIDELIQELCPDGVPVRQLGDVAEVQRGRSITRSEVTEGPVPVLAGGQQPSCWHIESNREGENVVIAGSGAYAGFVSYWVGPIWVSDSFSIAGKPNLLLTKFCFYLLKNRQADLHQMKKGSGVPHVYAKDVANLFFPVPPIEVQREIVSILDKFTQLEAELEAELEARRIQYEVTRDRLLDFSGDLEGHPLQGRIPMEFLENVRLIRLADLVKTQSPAGKIPRSKFLEDGLFPIVDQSQALIAGFTDDESLVNDLEPCVVFGDHTREIKYVDFPFAAGADGTVILLTSGELSARFLFYSLQSLRIQSRGYNRHWSVVKEHEISIPPLVLQQEIVSILDKLDALVNDITIGLPAEIAARRKQYEYYRNKLLTFKELEAA